MVTDGAGLSMRGAALLVVGAGGCLIEPDPDFVDPRGDLLIEWSFAATPVADGSGNDNTLELQGATIVDGIGRFDGEDDLGVGPDLANVLPGLEAITIEARTRITDTSSDAVSRPILFVPQTSNSGAYGLGLVVDTASRGLQFELVAGNMHALSYRDHLYEDDWVTVHGVYDGEHATLFVDGEAPVDPIAVHGGLDADDSGAQTVTVAGRSDGGDNLGCELASIMVWTRALSEAEVAYRHAQLR